MTDHSTVGPDTPPEDYVNVVGADPDVELAGNQDPVADVEEN